MLIDEALVLRMTELIPRAARVEIARSFSFKLNVGNFESRDFFCSQKAECDLEDSAATAEALHLFCKSQVMQAVREYRESAALEARAVESRIQDIRNSKLRENYR